MTKGSIEIEVAGRTLTISNPDRVYFPTGETKLDVIEYYLDVEDVIMRQLGDRPVLLQRFPRGVTESNFFQKRIPNTAPEWLTRTTVSTVNGTESEALVIADLAHLVWAVGIGCIGFHVWPAKSTNVEIVDQLRIDLDPSPGQTFADIVQAAKATKKYLDQNNLPAGIKSSGNKGVHIFLELESKWTATQVRSAAVTIARQLESEYPDILTARWWKEEREKKVFVDFNQNAPHKTVFGAWSVRPVPGVKVSTPIDWQELDDIKPDELNIRTVPERLAKAGDPWKDLKEASIERLVQEFEDHIVSGGFDEPWPPQYPKQPHEPPRVQPSRKKTD